MFSLLSSALKPRSRFKQMQGERMARLHLQNLAQNGLSLRQATLCLMLVSQRHRLIERERRRLVGNGLRQKCAGIDRVSWRILVVFTYDV